MSYGQPCELLASTQHWDTSCVPGPKGVTYKTIQVQDAQVHVCTIHATITCTACTVCTQLWLPNAHIWNTHIHAHVHVRLGTCMCMYMHVFTRCSDPWIAIIGERIWHMWRSPNFLYTMHGYRLRFMYFLGQVLNCAYVHNSFHVQLSC